MLYQLLVLLLIFFAVSTPSVKSKLPTILALGKINVLLRVSLHIAIGASKTGRLVPNPVTVEPDAHVVPDVNVVPEIAAPPKNLLIIACDVDNILAFKS